LELFEPYEAVTIAIRLAGEKICSLRAMRRNLRDVRGWRHTFFSGFFMSSYNLNRMINHEK